MTDFHGLVPIPPPTDINTGLSALRSSTMLKLFGRPGRLTRDCSAITNKAFAAQIVTHTFNNFTVEGWKPAVNSLVAVLTEVYAQNKPLHAVVRTAGMLCCRAVRGSSVNFSNHSWGCAIDLMIEGQLDELGSETVQRGILELYPYFHRHGWFAGMGYSTRPDPMHFELADETVRRLYKEMHG